MSLSHLSSEVLANVELSKNRFTLSNINKLDRTRLPNVNVNGLLWYVAVRKVELDDDCALRVDVICKDKEMLEKKSYAAALNIKLISHNDRSFEGIYLPAVFERNSDCWGNTLLGWKELIDPENGFVKNEEIILEVKIKASPINTIITMEKIEGCCEETGHASFNLNVTHIDELIAATSPTFSMRCLKWKMEIIRNDECNGDFLGICLRVDDGGTTSTSCKITGKIALWSTNPEQTPFEVAITDQICARQFPICLSRLAPWADIINPDNGFMNPEANNSINITATLSAGKPEGMPEDSLKCRRSCVQLDVQCTICSVSLIGGNISSLPCGHMFCTTCIMPSLMKVGFCPVCNTPTTVDDMRPVHLPIISTTFKPECA